MPTADFYGYHKGLKNNRIPYAAVTSLEPNRVKADPRVILPVFRLLPYITLIHTLA